MEIKAWTKSYINNLKKYLDSLDPVSIKEASELLWHAYQNERFVFVAGNGGSVSTASHMVCDFSKTVRGHKGDSAWKGFKMISLADNNSLISAWSNDTSYDIAYGEQLKNLATKDDLLIAISSSGNSQNIINTVKAAHELGMKVIGISGFGGGKLALESDISLVTDSKEYGPIEDIQLILNHLLVFYFYNKLSEDSKSKH